MFQHTAARRRLLEKDFTPKKYGYSFNTQPPEGGCSIYSTNPKLDRLFQHTAARRRLPEGLMHVPGDIIVSTHSRPKAAACALQLTQYQTQVSTHSRPKAAAFCFFHIRYLKIFVSTHSRPKAAAPYIKKQEKSVY